MALAGVAGVAGGWFGHAVYRRRSRAASSTEVDSASLERSKSAPATSAPVPAVAPTTSEVGPRAVSPNANTAGRVILHLALLGRLGSDDVAKLGYTQQGMTAALGIPQGSLAKILSRLEEADIVESGRRHVSGEPRRLKVYRLTGLGESVARDLRHRPPEHRP